MSYTSWQLHYLVAALWPGKRMPFLWLRHFDADQYATALVLLLRRPDNDRAVIEEILPQDMIDLINKARGEQKSRILDLRAGPHPGGHRRGQSRIMSFIRCRIRDTLLRQGDSPTAWEAKWEEMVGWVMVGWVRAALVESGDCRFCGVAMITEFPPVEKVTPRPALMTMDCIVPRCNRGGGIHP
ncbi:unnamed protein product [Parajaminaea phylloscopi]